MNIHELEYRFHSEKAVKCRINNDSISAKNHETYAENAYIKMLLIQEK